MSNFLFFYLIISLAVISLGHALYKLWLLYPENPLKNKKGVSFLDVITSTVILATTAITITPLTTNYYSYNSARQVETNVIQTATNITEQFSNIPYDSLQPIQRISYNNDYDYEIIVPQEYVNNLKVITLNLYKSGNDQLLYTTTVNKLKIVALQAAGIATGINATEYTSTAGNDDYKFVFSTAVGNFASLWWQIQDIDKSYAFLHMTYDDFYTIYNSPNRPTNIDAPALTPIPNNVINVYKKYIPDTWRTKNIIQNTNDCVWVNAFKRPDLTPLGIGIGTACRDKQISTPNPVSNLLNPENTTPWLSAEHPTANDTEQLTLNFTEGQVSQVFFTTSQALNIQVSYLNPETNTYQIISPSTFYQPNQEVVIFVHKQTTQIRLDFSRLAFNPTTNRFHATLNKIGFMTGGQDQEL